MEFARRAVLFCIFFHRRNTPFGKFDENIGRCKCMLEMEEENPDSACSERYRREKNHLQFTQPCSLSHDTAGQCRRRHPDPGYTVHLFVVVAFRKKKSRDLPSPPTALRTWSSSSPHSNSRSGENEMCDSFGALNMWENVT